MSDKYGRPISEILALPAYDLEWAAICFSIDDDFTDPNKRKELLKPIHMSEMRNEDAESKFRSIFD